MAVARCCPHLFAFFVFFDFRTLREAARREWCSSSWVVVAIGCSLGISELVDGAGGMTRSLEEESSEGTSASRLTRGVGLDSELPRTSSPAGVDTIGSELGVEPEDTSDSSISLSVWPSTVLTDSDCDLRNTLRR